MFNVTINDISVIYETEQMCRRTGEEVLKITHGDAPGKKIQWLQMPLSFTVPPDASSKDPVVALLPFGLIVTPIHTFPASSNFPFHSLPHSRQ